MTEGTLERAFRPERILPLEMLGYAIMSRILLIITGWYINWAIYPNWPDFIQGNRWIFGWAQWDGYHYARIAFGGYGNTDDPGISAFFPLYPLIMKISATLFGVDSMRGMQTVGVVVGWLLFLVATWAMTAMFRDYFGDEHARTMMLLWLFSPFAFFLSAAYTEGLFMTLVALCFIFLRKEKFWFAALMGALATATRITGLALVLPIVWVAWRKRASIVQIGALGLIAISGLLSYMTYTWWLRDDPIAFLNAQKGWGGFDIRAGNYYRAVLLDRQDFVFADVGNPIMFLNMAMYGVALLLFLYGLRRIPWEFSLFSAAVLFQTFLSVQSMGRYLLPVLTTYIAMAFILHRLPKKEYWTGIVVVGSTIGMVALFILFAHGAWIV